jgi:hypothetical protein
MWNVRSWRIAPPCSSTMPFVITRPSPAPSASGRLVAKSPEQLRALFARHPVAVVHDHPVSDLPAPGRRCPAVRREANRAEQEVGESLPDQAPSTSAPAPSGPLPHDGQRSSASSWSRTSRAPGRPSSWLMSSARCQCRRACRTRRGRCGRGRCRRVPPPARVAVLAPRRERAHHDDDRGRRTGRRWRTGCGQGHATPGPDRHDGRGRVHWSVPPGPSWTRAARS